MDHYKDIYVVETPEEAEEFRYEHNNERVEIGTPVGIDKPSSGRFPWLSECKLHCFDGIYFQPKWEDYLHD
jgi:hypothetical protein